MKNLIEARDSKVAELDGLLSELDEMTEGEEFDGKLARSKDLHVEIKDLEEKITDAREAAETLKAVKESREELSQSLKVASTSNQKKKKNSRLIRLTKKTKTIRN